MLSELSLQGSGVMSWWWCEWDSIVASLSGSRYPASPIWAGCG